MTSINRHKSVFNQMSGDKLTEDDSINTSYNPDDIYGEIEQENEQKILSAALKEVRQQQDTEGSEFAEKIVSESNTIKFIQGIWQDIKDPLIMLFVVEMLSLRIVKKTFRNNFPSIHNEEGGLSLMGKGIRLAVILVVFYIVRYLLNNNILPKK